MHVWFESIRILSIECAEADKRRIGPTAGVVRIDGDVAFGAASDELAFARGGRSRDFEGGTGAGDETGERD